MKVFELMRIRKDARDWLVLCADLSPNSPTPYVSWVQNGATGARFSGHYYYTPMHAVAGWRDRTGRRAAISQEWLAHMSEQIAAHMLLTDDVQAEVVA